ncbi:methylase involved in ubiquinone/menaquinone biosynthesis [Rubidibacter lacunae KORDI 51-2]|uniref:Methylase involved in ubiquinone/menaquinone biosynthesis n=1 Tax=Rubidibacter lacunae KORDI 51-2 TaxID=582515 RepID=U5DL63_9CHRO|nr:methylase involved in ubiquinone/menaquinone biosynthesis [Rubidibacter lacunae KORDI 51-2]
MATGKDTLWDRFLKPIATTLIDGEAIHRQYAGWDWDAARDRFSRPDLEYPEYYRTQNFHGIAGGYLTADAAITYDPVTHYALPPNEDWIRADAVRAVGGSPRAILDLGCGTGSTTLLFKRAFPKATVLGLDLSPFMLAVADDKARRANLTIRWQHGLAEATGLPPNEFDLVTASLLFHETPASATKAILREAFRLLRPNGQFLTLDGNQVTLRTFTWLTEIFEEPYICDYAAGTLDDWLQSTGFEAVRTQPLWGLHQVSSARKPLVTNVARSRSASYPANESPAAVPARSGSLERPVTNP